MLIIYLFTDAIASGESVRLAPSLRSQKGAIWTKTPINFDWWEVDIMFKVTGRGRIGADGLVSFWDIFLKSCSKRYITILKFKL